MDKNLKGSLYITVAAIFNSLLPVFSNSKSSNLSPFWIVATGSLISLLVFLTIFIARSRLNELKQRKAVCLSCLAGLIIGVFYNGLVYIGTYYTSPQNASIIVTFDVLVAMIMLRKVNTEKITTREVFGGMLMLFSGIALFLPESFKVRSGDLILLIACLLTPAGNLIMKKARSVISAETILLIRTTVSSFCLVLIALLVSGVPESQNINNSILLLVANGILVLGLSKLFFLEGINLIAISKASSIMSSSPVLTFIFAWFFLNDYPDWNQLIALPVCLSGFWLIICGRPKRI